MAREPEHRCCFLSFWPMPKIDANKIIPEGKNRPEKENKQKDKEFHSSESYLSLLPRCLPSLRVTNEMN